MSFTVNVKQQSGDDVTFWVGELIEEACLLRSPPNTQGYLSLPSLLRHDRQKMGEWGISTNSRWPAQKERIPAHFEFSLVHLIMQASTRKCEIKSGIKGMSFLSMKPSDAHAWTFDFWLPAPMIFLTAFLTGISSGIFCWEGKCLEHLFRCHEALLC